MPTWTAVSALHGPVGEIHSAVDITDIVCIGDKGQRLPGMPCSEPAKCALQHVRGVLVSPNGIVRSAHAGT
jgi:hypothetical protein